MYICVKWHINVFDHVRVALMEENAYQRLREPELYHPQTPSLALNNISYYFDSSYIHEALDRNIKLKINKRAAKAMKDMFIPHSGRITVANRRRVAIVSAVWERTHSVYRNFAPYVKALQAFYDVTLIAIVAGKVDSLKRFEKMGFVDIIPCCAVPALGNETIADALQNIVDRDFSLILYTDIGMHPQTILLANQRLAPIQVMSYGHSVSTFGAEIDYFLGGEEVEDISLAKLNYLGERLLLLPGLGIVNIPPRSQRERYILNTKKQEKQRREIVVNCPWVAHKINFEHLLLLRKILKQTDKFVIFRFFAFQNAQWKSSLVKENIRLVIQGDSTNKTQTTHLRRSFDVEVIGRVPQSEYLNIIDQGDLTLDSHHWGSCNTAVDAFFMGTPIVLLEGKKWNNRIGPAIARRVGMNELIAQNASAFVSIAKKVINNDRYRTELRRRILNADVHSLLFSNGEEKWYPLAFYFLQETHLRAKMNTQQKRSHKLQALMKNPFRISDISRTWELNARRQRNMLFRMVKKLTHTYSKAVVIHRHDVYTIENAVILEGLISLLSNLNVSISQNVSIGATQKPTLDGIDSAAFLNHVIFFTLDMHTPHQQLLVNGLCKTLTHIQNSSQLVIIPIHCSSHQCMKTLRNFQCSHGTIFIMHDPLIFQTFEASAPKVILTPHLAFGRTPSHYKSIRNVHDIAFFSYNSSNVYQRLDKPLSICPLDAHIETTFAPFRYSTLSSCKIDEDKNIAFLNLSKLQTRFEDMEYGIHANLLIKIFERIAASARVIITDDIAVHALCLQMGIPHIILKTIHSEPILRYMNRWEKKKGKENIIGTGNHRLYNLYNVYTTLVSIASNWRDAIQIAEDFPGTVKVL